MRVCGGGIEMAGQERRDCEKEIPLRRDGKSASCLETLTQSLFLAREREGEQGHWEQFYWQPGI